VILNLAVAAILTPVFNGTKASRDPDDATSAADYLA
jgi:hypothetical protein